MTVFPRAQFCFSIRSKAVACCPSSATIFMLGSMEWCSGGYRAGVYCSGIPFRESTTVSVVTANDIRDHAGGREIHFFVSNDQCGPSPGCVFPKPPPAPAAGGVPFADAWQFAQSPRRPEMTAACRATYAPDGNCYPPNMSASTGVHVDVDTANSSDPSHARVK